MQDRFAKNFGTLSMILLLAELTPFNPIGTGRFVIRVGQNTPRHRKDLFPSYKKILGEPPLKFSFFLYRMTIHYIRLYKITITLVPLSERGGDRENSLYGG